MVRSVCIVLDHSWSSLWRLTQEIVDMCPHTGTGKIDWVQHEVALMIPVCAVYPPVVVVRGIHKITTPRPSFSAVHRRRVLDQGDSIPGGAGELNQHEV